MHVYFFLLFWFLPAQVHGILFQMRSSLMLLCLKLNYKKWRSMRVGPREMIRPLFLKSAMDCKGLSNVAQPMLNWKMGNHLERCLCRNLPFRAKRPETPACQWSRGRWKRMRWLVLVSRKRAQRYVWTHWNNSGQNNWGQSTINFSIRSDLSNRKLIVLWPQLFYLI